MKSNTIKVLRNVGLCLFVLFSVAACKKKEGEKCVPPALSSHIVGNWQAAALGNINLVFKQDGKIEGNLAPFFALAGLTTVEEVSYTTNGDNGVSISGVSGGNPVGPLAFTVKERECDKITLSMALGDIVLTR